MLAQDGWICQCQSIFRNLLSAMRKSEAGIHCTPKQTMPLELKGKLNQTRPSILCVTQKRAFMPLYIVLGQHRACMPVYIGKSGHLVGWHWCLTGRQTTENRATQLLSSIQFKLSHAIYVVIFVLIFWIFQHFFLEIAELACRQNCQPISFWACTKHRRIVLQYWIEAILITKQYKESLISWKKCENDWSSYLCLDN